MITDFATREAIVTLMWKNIHYENLRKKYSLWKWEKYVHYENEKKIFTMRIRKKIFTMKLRKKYSLDRHLFQNSTFFCTKVTRAYPNFN